MTVLTVLISPERSIETMSSDTSSAPKRSAWARISSIRAGPMMPSRKPGKFSTSVVFIRAPPAVTEPSKTKGWRDARAAYTAAVYPAGPEPTMMTLRTSCDCDM